MQHIHVVTCIRSQPVIGQEGLVVCCVTRRLGIAVRLIKALSPHRWQIVGTHIPQHTSHDVTGAKHDGNEEAESGANGICINF